MTSSKGKLALDVLLWAGAAVLAFALRLDGIPGQYLPALAVYVGLGIAVSTALVYVRGLHRQVWSAVGMPDLWRLGECVGLGAVVLFGLGLLVSVRLPFPRSVPLIHGALALIALGGVRLGARIRRERVGLRAAGIAQRVLVVGAGDAGSMIAREMLRHPEARITPVGFLDDAPAKQRQRLMGIPVLGPLPALPEAARKCRADEVLIAMPSAPGSVVRRVVELARQAGLNHRIIPGMYEILTGKVSIDQIREVHLEDLLRREPVWLDPTEMSAYLAGRTVLVTGAGGSIGAEIVRQVARFHPREVLLLGRGENSLFELEAELKRAFSDLKYQVFVGDVRDRDRLTQVFGECRPQVVFHAAAHKHVPLMERNPGEAVVNNVVGTRTVVELALRHGVERFVNISTDKAVNPTSVMGATKRVAEHVVSWAARRAVSGQAFVSVRFGNVLGSRGSVVPLFKEQIRHRGPVTVTHPEMKRYFMTIPEAVQLVLQAAALGENGAVYVLDMGEPVRIVDLAQDLIRLSGFEPDVDIAIEFTGVRPGEKLFEEMLTAEEGTVATCRDKIHVARGEAPLDSELETKLGVLVAAAREGDGAAIRRVLKELVPTYQCEA